MDGVRSVTPRRSSAVAMSERFRVDRASRSGFVHTSASPARTRREAQRFVQKLARPATLETSSESLLGVGKVDRWVVRRERSVRPVPAALGPPQVPGRDAGVSASPASPPRRSPPFPAATGAPRPAPGPRWCRACQPAREFAGVSATRKLPELLENTFRWSAQTGLAISKSRTELPDSLFRRIFQETRDLGRAGGRPHGL